MNTLSPRQKRTSKRRRDILNASLQCFLAHGVEAATIEQIRDISGASSGSIYHHFGSKQAIAIALYVEGLEELGNCLRREMAAHNSLEEGVGKILQAYFDWVSTNRDWALYLLRVATADLTADESQAIDEVNRVAREDLANWLKPFEERGEILFCPPELSASLVYGASTHFMRHWLSGRIETDLGSAVKRLAEAAYVSLAVTGAPGVERRGT